MVVLLDHASESFDIDTPLWGHQAVIVFFVLSGYVISMAAAARENTGRSFLVARLSRLWSVLVPALMLTIACDVIGLHIGTQPGVYNGVHFNQPVLRVGAALLFLSESWVSIQPLSNGVIWSLCCEFWYYMMFAAWIFLAPGRLRLLALALLAVVSGYKALLLLPIWLMGVALHRVRWLRSLGPVANAALLAGSTLAIACVLAFRLYNPAIGWMQAVLPPFVFAELAQARVFWLDWIMGLLVAAHLLGIRGLIGKVPVKLIGRPVRWCAGVSFACYLFHVPLFYLWRSRLPANQGWLAVALTLAVIAILGPPVERSRKLWRPALDRLAGHLTGVFHRVTPKSADLRPH